MLISQDEEELGVLGDVINVNVTTRFVDMSEISFDLMAYSPFYDEVFAKRYIELKPFGVFMISKVDEHNDGKQEHKSVTATSREVELCFRQTYISAGTYALYNPTDTSRTTLMRLLLDDLPGWSLGEVPTSIIGKFRTFDVVEANIYDFMMNIVQKTYGVVFIFDSTNRVIHIRDVTIQPTEVPVYLSMENLIENATITDLSEDVVTCLSVHGAEGVDIRSANPIGTNKIYNLDYYLSKNNSKLKPKWDAWKTNLIAQHAVYLDFSVSRNVAYAKYLSENAKMTELKSNVTALETRMSAIIEGMAIGATTQEQLNATNEQIAQAKQAVVVQNSNVTALYAEYEARMEQLKSINDACRFEAFFTAEEIVLLQNYIQEDSMQDTTFVARSVESFNTPSVSKMDMSFNFAVSGAMIAQVTSGQTTTLDITGGVISASGEGVSLSGDNTHAVIQYNSTTKTYVFSSYLINVTHGTEKMASGTLTSNGTFATQSSTPTSATLNTSASNLFFTSNVTEYQRQSVEQELFEFATAALKTISEPAFEFDIDLINFLALDEFTAFREKMALGAAVYVDLGNDFVVTPMLLELNVAFGEDNIADALFVFGNKYRKSTGMIALEEIINDTSYTSRKADYTKFNASDFIASGAKSDIARFMSSVFDTSLNAIKSGTDIAISWDGAGLFLRKYISGSTDDYMPEQIGMINNGIYMTDDGWNSLQVAIGKFVDPQMGSLWGVQAGLIAGHMVIGQGLAIETEKQFGGVAQVKIDAQGAQFNNTRIVQTTDGSPKMQIISDPTVGLAAGLYPLFTINESDDKTILKKENATFYLDNVTGEGTFKGKIYAKESEFEGKVIAHEGEFTGKITATSGSFKGVVQASRFLDSAGRDMFDNALNKFNSDYLNLKGLSISDQYGAVTFSVASNGKVKIKGDIEMDSGSITWTSVNRDPEITTAKNMASTASTTAASAAQAAGQALNNASNAFAQAQAAHNTAIGIANGTSGIVGTFIDGTTIKSPTIMGANIYGGSITSNTTIDVGTDIRVGNNIIMMSTDMYGSMTGSLQFGGKAKISMNPNLYGLPALSLNTENANDLIEITNGAPMGGSANGYSSGEVVIRGNRNVRIGTSMGGGAIFLHGVPITYDGTRLLVNGSPIGGGGGGTAVFA